MTEKQVSIKLVQDIFANLCDFSGENLVSKQEDEAEEADEGRPDPPYDPSTTVRNPWKCVQKYANTFCCKIFFAQKIGKPSF